MSGRSIKSVTCYNVLGVANDLRYNFCQTKSQLVYQATMSHISKVKRDENPRKYLYLINFTPEFLPVNKFIIYPC